GQSNPTGVQKRVVSGTTALPGAWPWQALLLLGYRNNAGFVCSGALVHPSWVLTAAHCIYYQKSPSLYSVRLGEFDRSTNEGREQTIEVEKIFI
uniref:trypsin-like serine protease n=1 Tax=Salmonella sp. s54925 TaxID=3159674 RepID=UPI0039800425